jgi:hypothetical protein
VVIQLPALCGKMVAQRAVGIDRCRHYLGLQRQPRLSCSCVRKPRTGFLFLDRDTLSALETAPSGWSPRRGARGRGPGDVRRSRPKLRSTQQRGRVRLRPRRAVRAWTLTWPPSAARRCREGKWPPAASRPHLRLERAAKRAQHAGHRRFRVRGSAASPVCTEADSSYRYK